MSTPGCTESATPHDPPAVLDAAALARALALRDLADPTAGPHAMQLVLGNVIDALVRAWGCALQLHRGHPVVSTRDNYDRLRYASAAVARDARYTRYVSATHVLRSHTSAMVPPLLEDLARAPLRDTLLACPGLVYRRDAIDKLHTGEPHQLDLWRVRAGARLGVDDLRDMVARVVTAALPGREHRVTAAEHPYTTDGLQIDVRDGNDWVEIGECGLAHPEVLADSGLDPMSVSGLAMGLGLDRLVMLSKGIDDIRLLRANDPRVASQLLDLAPYRAVSRMPPVRRDLSLVVRADATTEDLGDRVRAALGPRSGAVEHVGVLAETPYERLLPAARARLGLEPAQKNVLVRVVLRDLERTLTHAEANALRDAIYAALHEGPVMEWAAQ